jgi:hypothetical protein
MHPDAVHAAAGATTKERWSMYQVKRHGLPLLYWRAMLKEF